MPDSRLLLSTLVSGVATRLKVWAPRLYAAEQARDQSSDERGQYSRYNRRELAQKLHGRQETSDIEHLVQTPQKAKKSTRGLDRSGPGSPDYTRNETACNQIPKLSTIRHPG